MNNFELADFKDFPAPLTQLTCTPYGQAYVASSLKFIKYNIRFENGTYKIDPVLELELKYQIIRFIVIPEIHLGLIHCGQNVYSIDLQTFKHQKILNDVQHLVPHHPGFEPVLVPLQSCPQSQESTITADIQSLPFHPMISGVFKAISLPQKPLIKDKFAQIDFLVVQNNQINTVICYSKREIFDTPCQYGSGALETFCLDERPSILNMINTLDVLQFEIYQNLSGYHHTNSEISSPTWVGDRIYYENDYKYYSVDFKLLKFHKVPSGSDLLQLQLALPIVAMPQIGQYSHLNKQLINNIRTFGTISNPLLLQNTITAEAVRRLKRGLIVSKVPMNVQNCGSTLYNLDQLSLTDKDFKIGDNYGASYLREANQLANNSNFEDGGIIHGQNVNQMQVEQNIQPNRLLEAIHKQLSIQNSNQSIQHPHLFVAFPVQIAFNLDPDWYIIDSEKWDRQLEPSSEWKGQLLRRVHSSFICTTGTQLYYSHGVNDNQICQTIQLPSDQPIVRLQTLPINASLFCQQQYEIMNLRSDTVQYTPFLIASQTMLYKVVKRRFSNTLLERIRQHEKFEEQDLKKMRQQYKDIPDAQELSMINTAIGLAFFNNKQFLDAAACFVEARLLNPLDVCKLFLGNLEVSDLQNKIVLKRSQMPPLNMVAQCDFLNNNQIGEEFMRLHSDDYYKGVVDMYNSVYVTENVERRDMHADEFLGIKESIQECVFQKQFYSLPNLLQLLAMFASKQIGNFYSMPDVFIWPSKEYRNEQVKALLYYLRIYLDFKANWQPILRTILRDSMKQGIETRYIEQLITPAINQINRQQQKDDNFSRLVQILRCVMILCLVSEPMNIPQELAYAFMVARPEDLQNVIQHDNFQRQVQFCSEKEQIIPLCISFLSIFRYFYLCARILSIMRQQTAVPDQKSMCLRGICLFYSYGINNDIKRLTDMLQSVQLSNTLDKLIFWQFVPYINTFDQQFTLQLMIQKIKYQIRKGEKVDEIEQPLFFEQFQFKKSGSMKGYYKPSNQQLEKIEEFATMFSPKLLLLILQELRNQDLKSNSPQIDKLESEQHHQGIIQIAIFYASQCVQISYEQLNKYLDLQNYATNWKSQVLKKWLSQDAADLLCWLLPLQANDDEPQKKFAMQALQSLQVLVEGLQNGLSQLENVSVENNLSIDMPTSQVSDDKVSGISPAKQPNEASQNSNCSQQQNLKIQSLTVGNDNHDQYNKLLYQQLLSQFSSAFLLAAVKSNEQQAASNMLFIQLCEPRGKFANLFRIALQLYKKNLITENKATTKQEHLQKIFSQIKDFKDQKFVIDINQFELLVQKCCTISLPFYEEKAKSTTDDFEEQRDIIQKQRLYDCMAFSGVEDIGQSCRAPVSYLFDFALRLSIVCQLEMISLSQYDMCMQRLLSTNAESGELLAQFCLTRILNLLPREICVTSVLQFMQYGFKLQHLESGRHAIDQVRAIKERTDTQKELLAFEQGSQLINAFTKCDRCGALLLRGAGTLQFRSMQKLDGSLGIQHLDCDFQK